MSDKPLFGRRWQVQVLLNDRTVLDVSNSSFEPEALQVQFETFQPAMEASFWYADVIIFNLNEHTNNVVLTEGMDVRVSAGYQDESRYGEIFKGKIFQPMWDRDNVTDFRTTLHCLVGKAEIAKNFVAQTYAAYVTQTEIVRRMAAASYRPLTIETLSSNIKSTKLPRGQVLFGSPRDYLNQVARDNNMQWWISGNGINLGDITEDVPRDQALVITPENGLVGTPQQTQQGIIFRTLLDPRIRVKLNPPMQVKLDNASIRQRKKQIGEISLLDQDGFYNVGAVRHFGDSRGNDWYTEVVGYAPAFGKASAMGALENKR